MTYEQWFWVPVGVIWDAIADSERPQPFARGQHVCDQIGCVWN